jgi:hypothetical protein
VRETPPLFEPLTYESDLFTKTGLGQTWEKLPKTYVFLREFVEVACQQIFHPDLNLFSRTGACVRQIVTTWPRFLFVSPFACITLCGFVPSLSWQRIDFHSIGMGTHRTRRRFLVRITEEDQRMYPCEKSSVNPVRNTPLFAMPLIYKMDHFTKTGSGQTWEKLRKEWLRFSQKTPGKTGKKTAGASEAL